MQKIFLVSNRLPVTVERRRGTLRFQESIGGLASGLEGFHAAREESRWIGWPGIAADRLTREDMRMMKNRLAREHRCIPVFLSQEEIEGYYNGFGNGTIWPLFHTFPQFVHFREEEWDMYRTVNDRFRRIVRSQVTEEDIVWIHDYHLFLLPQMLRRDLPNLTIGFFLHIPFPSFDLLRMLPWNAQLLAGMAGADLVGFHTFDDVLHFLQSMQRTLGIDHEMGRLAVDDRIVKVDAFPLGIDFDRFVTLARERVTQRRVRAWRKQIGERRVILSMDRLDYTKGIAERLHAFRSLLQRFPQYRQNVTLLLVAPLSRAKMRQYRDMKKEIDELVGDINGSFGTIGWTPVRYLSHPLTRDQLVGLYLLADIALITPLRDGMNLIAKEYLACRLGNRGMLVLSEMAGAAKELSEAVLVNPSHQESVVQGLLEALRMTEREQSRRNRIMRGSLRRRTSAWWTDRFLTELGRVKALQTNIAYSYLSPTTREAIARKFDAASHRLLILDYDGTLVSFRPKPEFARPSARVRRLLTRLAETADVVIASGRPKRDLERWFGDIPLGFVAEHGGWMRQRGGEWRLLQTMDTEWKRSVRDILEQYVDITPGSFIEEKEFSLVWHARLVDPELWDIRSRDLMSVLRNMTANLPLDTQEGKRIIEVKVSGFDKGRAIQEWLLADTWDFLLAAGDDTTDEDIFRVLPENAVTIRVGDHPSRAVYRVPSHTDILSLLQDMVDVNVQEE